MLNGAFRVACLDCQLSIDKIFDYSTTHVVATDCNNIYNVTSHQYMLTLNKYFLHFLLLHLLS